MRYILIAKFIIVFIVLVSVSLCCCINNDSLSSKSYVAIEEEMYDNGVLISGTPGIAEAPLPPIFYYDNTIPRYSYPSEYPLMNDSLKILYGTFYTDSTPEYLRKQLTVHGIFGYPYQLESGPIIKNVDMNGTIRMSYDNEIIYLKVNDTWTSPIIMTRITNISSIYGNYTYTVEYTITWKVTNKGVYEKDISKSS